MCVFILELVIRHENPIFYAPCYITICVLSVCLSVRLSVCLYHVFAHFLRDSTILKEFIEHKICVLTFSTTFIWNIFRSNRN